MGYLFLVASRGGLMRFAPGLLVANRYEIVAFHLEGGMQEVYRCFDRALDRTVALKTPKEGIVDKRFSRGAQMGARVNHPNVAATLDYVEEGGVSCLIEEFIEGIDLGRRLAKEYLYLDPSLATWVVHNIAKGLQAAHKVGICHRDLKPSNIMTSGDAQLSVIKLTDFGIAKLAQSELEVEMERFEQDENTLTSSSTLLGAVPYLAPECWTDWKSAGQPADIWAFGAIACHLLLGKAPFGAGRAAIMKMAQAQTSGVVEITPPEWFGLHASTAAVEVELWEMIANCLLIEPKERPSADGLIAKIDSLLYSTAKRRTGTITVYPTSYANGQKSASGRISIDDVNETGFFHGSDFYGSTGPQPGQRVTFSSFPGNPYPRCTPVLLLKP